MGSPYDLPYVVPANRAPMEYAGRCYAEGEVIQMKSTDYWACAETEVPEDLKKCGFPEYCVGPDGVPFAGYRVPFVIPEGETLVLPIPVKDGCKPNKVRFFYCSNCVYLGVDADPITDPTDPVGMTGGGGYPNPVMIDLTGCEDTLHLSSDDAADVSGMAMFYC